MASWSEEYGLIGCAKMLALIHITISVGMYVAILLFGVQLKKREMHKGRILLITAHPDDECMFFSPFLLGAVEQKVEVHVLCLTNGNYYGQGNVREKEIIDSCQILGIPGERVTVLNDSRLPDDPKALWDGHCLESHILAAVDRVHPQQIVTFDDYGVSGHSNHITVSMAVRNLFNNGDRLKGVESVLYLESISVWRKYLGVLEIPFTFVSSSHAHLLSPVQVLHAQRAMLSHRSQLQWFRLLYIVLSRYMLVNTFHVQRLAETGNSNT